jgi:catechol 2,3-dioxygenase-like lactoylglutathione lyase family enzyme
LVNGINFHPEDRQPAARGKPAVGCDVGVSTKLQSQGVHRTTLVGAERQNSVDFRQGVLGMPLAFEQPNLHRPEPSHLNFDSAPAPAMPSCWHDIRLAHGANNIADEHLAGAIEPPSRKPAPAGKK